MAEDIIHESEMWIPAKNGIGKPPRILACPECRTEMRRLPGNRYICHACDSETTLDLTPLEHRKAKP